MGWSNAILLFLLELVVLLLYLRTRKQTAGPGAGDAWRPSGVAWSLVPVALLAALAAWSLRGRACQ